MKMVELVIEEEINGKHLQEPSLLHSFIAERKGYLV
jgi:hypothetical protein